MTVHAYFRMFSLELAGESYTKTEFRRQVDRDVDHSSGAIKYKINNVSAVLDELGTVWIPGNKPRQNVQDRLRTVVRERFEEDNGLRSFMVRAVADGNVPRSELGVEVDPRPRTGPLIAGRELKFDINLAAIGTSNRALRRADADSFVAAERRRRAAAGREYVAAEVRQVSVADGDGLGYDVLSYQGMSDEPAFIEVKRLRYGEELPFYIAVSEVEASIDLGPA